MSKPFIDKHSGAVIFQSTPEEIKIQELERRCTALEKKTEMLEKMLKRRKKRW